MHDRTHDRMFDISHLFDSSLPHASSYTNIHTTKKRNETRTPCESTWAYEAPPTLCFKSKRYLIKSNTWTMSMRINWMISSRLRKIGEFCILYFVLKIVLERESVLVLMCSTTNMALFLNLSLLLLLLCKPQPIQPIQIHTKKKSDLYIPTSKYQSQPNQSNQPNPTLPIKSKSTKTQMKLSPIKSIRNSIQTSNPINPII